MDWQEKADYFINIISNNGETISWQNSDVASDTADNQPWKAATVQTSVPPVTTQALFVGKRASSFTAILSFLKGTDVPVNTTTAFVLPVDGFTPDLHDIVTRQDGTKLNVKTVEIIKPGYLLIGYVVGFDS